MSNIVNLQVAGIPIITYGLIGMTTAVLAYATVSGGLGDMAAKSIGLVGAPPSSDEGQKSVSDKLGESLLPKEEGEPAKEEGREDKGEEAAAEVKGGKRRKHKRRTPRAKKNAGKKSKSHKHHK